jgi:hypothetical protein
MMQIGGEIGALDTRAVAAIDKQDVVDDPAFSAILYATPLVIPHRSGEVSTRGLLFIGDQEAVLAQPLDSILDDRKHPPNRMHSMQVEVVRGGVIPLHSHEDHIRCRLRQCLKAATVKADAKIDQPLERLEPLRAVKEGVSMQLGSGSGGVFLRKNLGSLLNVESELRDVVRGDESNGKPIPLASYIGLVYVAQQHARPRAPWR